MKRIVIAIFMSMLWLTNGYAQECTTIWPYVYSEFQPGTVYFSDGQKTDAKFNVHVYKSRLHYLAGETIKEVANEGMVYATIGPDKYMVIDGRVMKVTGSEAKGFVAMQILGDFDSLTNQSGAYGGPTNSSAVNSLSSIEIGGIQITNHMQLLADKDKGTYLPLKYKYFVVTNGMVYPATRRGIISNLDENQVKPFKTFLKTHDIDWDNADSLLQILDFFNN